MGGWWVHDLWAQGRVIDLVAWIFWVLFSITLHELAHGWAAIWQGDDTPIRRHRLTLNPVTHMGTMSLIVFAVAGIAWGMMPVNPYKFRDGRRGDIYVSAAGPAMNIVIAIVSLILLVAWMKVAAPGSETYRYVSVFLYYGVALNLILAPFNLLPIPPLDGSRILAGFSRKFAEWYANPQAQLIGTFIFIAIFFMSPLGGVFFSFAWRAARATVDGAGSLVGNPSILPSLFP